MVTVIQRRLVALSAAALGAVAAFALPTAPASAAAFGTSSACTFTTTTRAQCNFPVISATFNSEVHYLTVQCTSTGPAFNLKDVQLLAIPPNGTADIAYQAGYDRPSVGGVANLGTIIDVYVKIDTTSAALIDFLAVPSGTTTCTASLTATY